MDRDLELKRCNQLKGEGVKIMAQASVYLRGNRTAAIEIRRGMTLVSIEGKEVGKVAGVAVSRDDQQALCLIISHLPQDPGYHSIPVDWVERVEGELIFLHAPVNSILAIPDWHAN